MDRIPFVLFRSSSPSVSSSTGPSSLPSLLHYPLQKNRGSSFPLLERSFWAEITIISTTIPTQIMSRCLHLCWNLLLSTSRHPSAKTASRIGHSFDFLYFLRINSTIAPNTRCSQQPPSSDLNPTSPLHVALLTPTKKTMVPTFSDFDFCDWNLSQTQLQRTTNITSKQDEILPSD